MGKSQGHITGMWVPQPWLSGHRDAERDRAAKGFIIGGVGRRQYPGCDGCKSTSGVAAAFHVGRMLTEKVALVLDSSGHQED